MEAQKLSYESGIDYFYEKMLAMTIKPASSAEN